MPMHTLYAFPFSCSLAVHVTLVQHDVPHALRWVQRGPGRQATSAELERLNPKRKVPTLVLPSGEVLTEIVGVLLYLDEQHNPGRPHAERRRLIEWLAFTATELHKTVLAPAFDPAVTPEARDDARLRLLPTAVAPLEGALAGRATLLGGPVPSVADVYVTAFSTIGSTPSAVTDSDGYYLITEVGAGTWEVRTFADSLWEAAVTTVGVAAGSTAVAPDLVLVPRFTGTISGLVGTTDGIPESEIGGVFDICVTVLTSDGAPVSGASAVTGGDSFYFF